MPQWREEVDLRSNNVRSFVLFFFRTQYRAKNDIYNAVGAGFISGALLARHSGPQAILGGGAAFAGFSAAIDLWLRAEPAE